MARDNPSDERLIAVAEVRDLTPVRDDDGRVVALPEVEHVLVGCLDAIRQALAERPGAAAAGVEPGACSTSGRSSTSRSTSCNAIARRLAPLTEGLGLEQVVVSGRLAVPAATSRSRR